jgi:hypothetical protein
MRHGGTVDVSKYAGVCTSKISGCNALAIVRIDGGVKECFFSHSTADQTKEFAEQAVAILKNDLSQYHAVLIENYGSADSSPKANVLLAAKLPPAQLLVYTNPFRQGDQTFGVRFSDGLIGEVHVREQTRSLTEPIARNQFLVGFDTVPPQKSELELLTVYDPNELADQYVMMFSLLDKGETLGASNLVVREATVQREHIVMHGEKILARYLQARRHDPQFQAIKKFLKVAYGDYKFRSLL